MSQVLFPFSGDNSTQQIFIERLLSPNRSTREWGYKERIGGGYSFINNNELLNGPILGPILRPLYA